MLIQLSKENYLLIQHLMDVSEEDTSQWLQVSYAEAFETIRDHEDCKPHPDAYYALLYKDANGNIFEITEVYNQSTYSTVGLVYDDTNPVVER